MQDLPNACTLCNQEYIHVHRRESEPASAPKCIGEELQPDLRSDSAPASSSPFSIRKARQASALHGHPSMLDSGSAAQSNGSRKPPLSGWRSHSDHGRGRTLRKGGPTYQRSLSAEHLPSTVSLAYQILLKDNVAVKGHVDNL